MCLCLCSSLLSLYRSGAIQRGDALRTGVAVWAILPRGNETYKNSSRRFLCQSVAQRLRRQKSRWKLWPHHLFTSRGPGTGILPMPVSDSTRWRIIHLGMWSDEHLFPDKVGTNGRIAATRYTSPRWHHLARSHAGQHLELVKRMGNLRRERASNKCECPMGENLALASRCP